jgi:hypothetical protein
MSVETYIYVVEGIDLEGEIPPAVRRAALRAVNYAAGRARTASGRAIRNRVNLPARYLTGSEGRLQLSQPASQSNLERVLTGRRRPISLAQYAKGGSSVRGVRVSVKPGVARYLKRGFLMKLRSGSDGSARNTGLAIRTDGAAPGGAFKPKKISDHLYLLYGLSVDVLFRGVIDAVSPDVQDNLENEFWRQLDLGAA